MAVLEEKDVMKMLEETEAVLHGHFLLTSGLHSPMYVEKFNVLQHPKYTERLCQEIARRYENDNVELVVGPMTGGPIRNPRKPMVETEASAMLGIIFRDFPAML